MYRRNCKKTTKLIAGLILGAGAGMLLILVLPPRAWLCIVSICLIIVGIKKVFEK